MSQIHQLLAFIYLRLATYRKLLSKSKNQTIENLIKTILIEIIDINCLIKKNIEIKKENAKIYDSKKNDKSKINVKT